MITALLFAGRAGTALASELGLMRATDQLSAMEMMAVDPIQRVVVPRFLGGVIAMPLLAAIFSLIGIYGAQLVGVQIMGVDSGSFWSQMRASVDLRRRQRGHRQELHLRRRMQPDRRLRGLLRDTDRGGGGRATTRTVVTLGGGGVVPGLFAYRGVFVRGHGNAQVEYVESWDGGLCAARLRGTGVSDHADDQPRLHFASPPHYDVTRNSTISAI